MNIQLNDTITIEPSKVQNTFFEALINSSYDKTIDAEAYSALSLITIDANQAEYLIDKYCLDKYKIFNMCYKLFPFTSFEFDNIYHKIINGTIDPNIQDFEGFTPIMYYASWKDSSKVLELIDKCGTNIDFNIQNKFGDTVLIWCCYNNMLDCIKKLITLDKCNYNIQSKNKLCALLLLRYENYECLKLLIDTNKCDYNLQDENGNTVLHTILSLLNKNTDSYDDMIKSFILLLETNKCNFNIKNNKGKTPLQLCSYHLIKLFESKNIKLP
jgi:hypothetical protein